MKNRVRQLRSLGSVRGEGGDLLAYSDTCRDAISRNFRPLTVLATVEAGS
jgi:hypothetical protein